MSRGAPKSLSLEGVVPFLLRLGLVTAADVVDGQVTVFDASRRNTSYRVLRAGRGGLFLKQSGAEEGAEEAVRMEAALLDLGARDEELAEARRFLPRFVHFDPASGTLVTELVEGARHLWQLSALGDSESVAAADRLGSALALLHDTLGKRVPDRLAARPGKPSILEVDRPDPRLLETISPANLALLRVIQGQPAFGEHLERMRRDWRPRTLVHGDIRSDNVLVAGSAPPPGGPSLCIVDWELAHLGDPAWDLGGAFHDYLACWIRSIPFGGGRSMQDQLAEARQPLATLRPAIRSLWDGYRDGARLERAEALDFLLSAIRYCGARLVQSAFEHGASADVMPGAAVAMLQVSANVLEDPGSASFGLLGIPLPTLPSRPAPVSPPTSSPDPSRRSEGPP